MNGTTTLGGSIVAVISALVERIVHLVPAAVGAAVLLLVGWLLARILRTVAVRGLGLLDDLAARLLPAGGGGLRLARSASAVGAIVFWVVILVFITAATQVLGLETFAVWLARLLDSVPTLVAGGLIVAAGWVLSRFTGDLVLAAAARVEPSQRVILARAAQVAILTVAILVGADQVGVKITFLVMLVGAIVITVGGGVTLAVSLGSQAFVANLIGARYFRQAFAVGDRIRVGGFEGRILEVTAVSVVLETDDGRVSLPSRVYHDEPIVLIAGERPRG